jgi:excisionase family DNA binding protein
MKVLHQLRANDYTLGQDEAKPARLRVRPADGLRTMAEAAARLGCSVKTLRGHVANGALTYVNLGRGRERQRMRFTDADLDRFITNQSRKDVPTCPSTKTRVRRSTSSISGGEVIAFTARQSAQPSAKRKP